MTSKADEQRERRRVLAQDARLREQAGTFMSHTHSDAGGRFSNVGAQTVVGQSEVTRYPAAAAHQRDPCGIEPPLGYSVNDLTPHELEPSLASPAQATDPTSADAPNPLGQRTDVGSLSNKLDRRF
jgi:hypothetical protein